MNTARVHDHNGWPEIKDNPLSKVGVFDYLGASINAPDPDRIYRVYRPEAELSDPDCIRSFELLPWVIQHTMIGTGGTPAEEKGIHGVIGEQVYFDHSDNLLKGNIKVFSDQLNEVIDNDYKELSLGYRCEYDFDHPGVFDGKAYDVIQRKIRGNHLASVPEGRMGKEVAVMDQLLITFDSKDFISMQTTQHRKPANETPPVTAAIPGTGQDDMSLSEITVAIRELSPLIGMVHQLTELANGTTGKGPEQETVSIQDPEPETGTEESSEGNPKESPGQEENDAETESGNSEDDDDESEDDDDETPAGDDDEMKPETTDGRESPSTAGKLAAMAREITRLKKQQATMDEKTLISSLTNRDELASRLSHHIGTFDHSRMTALDVARYGIEKLGIPCTDGTETIALNAWLHGRQPASKLVVNSFGMDAKTDVIRDLFGVH